ncbi:MAG: hypothetical protein RLZZ342_484 [Candidatus Parcubacteria bacterium]|jgi:drug/metabolite transporter (DMT)-like permease
MTVVDFDSARLERAAKKPSASKALIPAKTDLVIAESQPIPHHRIRVPWLLLSALVSLCLSAGCTIVGLAEYIGHESVDTWFQRASLILFSVSLLAFCAYWWRGFCGYYDD